ncbi:hypothetical protein ACFQ88_16015 [Paenibacillus sp. NPDC056579]|uniref:hypothetical protein n=1 Tax=unclassified Paenibacillus TaxID=185978 RepID=UPI001EF91F28|nr:hypothetical protein [Paenibacillus sp. H1-7]ULL17914.1 hypothetical protein DVH26_27700 [Paenibacillus sp. H1-7]
MAGAADSREMTLERRAQLIRRYEQACYQMCYYLLRSEPLAMEAALAAVETLLSDACFYEQEEQSRLEAVKRTAIRCSLKRIVV